MELSSVLIEDLALYGAYLCSDRHDLLLVLQKHEPSNTLSILLLKVRVASYKFQTKQSKQKKKRR